VISSASRTTSFGIVAEKSRVWRLARQRRDDAAHIGPEAHVHHAIRFVEDQQLDGAQIGVLLPHVIHQPSGRRDDDVDAGLERALLHPHLDAAVDGGAGDGGVIGEAVDLVFNLHCELARRREHEYARASSSWGSGRVFQGIVRKTLPDPLEQPLQRRDHECRGLAAAGFGARDQILLRQRQRDHRGLNRPRVLEPEIADAFEQPRVEAQ
jgi:hypothetical protein